MTALPIAVLVALLAAPLALGQREPSGGKPATPPAAPDKPAAPAAPAPSTDDPPAARGSLPPIEPPPALSAMEAEKLKRAIKKLRNDNAKYRHAAEQEVIAFGRGAIPLLEEAATTKDEAMMDALVNSLCGVADARDRDRVEANLASQLIPLRRFAAREAGDIGLPELLDRIIPLLGDADRPTQVEAALSLVRNGREEGLAVLTLAYGGSYGPGWDDRVLAALPGIANKGPHLEAATLLTIDPEREKAEPDVASNERLAAVKLLHAIGDPAATALLVRALDDHHNVVQREAINALRDLLEHKGPLEASSIFQQLNEVKRLKDVASAKK
jgi:HEAT repeat protein